MKHFVRMVEWAIRKVTNTMLLRNLKAGLSAERVEVRKKSEKHNCKDYQDHQDQLFVDVGFGEDLIYIFVIPGFGFEFFKRKKKGFG